MIPALLLAAALPMQPASSAYADEKGKALRNPEGVACTGNGAVVAGDTGNGRLVVYRFKDGAFVGGAEVAPSELGRPRRLQIDSKGNVLSLDGRTRRIARIGAGGEFAGFVAMKGVPPARGFFPVSFKLDAQDNAYVLDAASRRIVVVDAGGVFIRQIALPAGGTITDIAVDPRGVLYAVDAVRAVLWVQSKDGWSALSRQLRDWLNYPEYLAVTAQGPIVLVDSHGNGLVMLARDGSFLGRRLSIGSSEGSVYYPAQICVDARGDVFVADRANQRIQAFTPGQ